MNRSIYLYILALALALALTLALTVLPTCSSECEQQRAAALLWAQATIADTPYPQYKDVATSVDLVSAYGNHRPAQAPVLSISKSEFLINRKHVAIEALRSVLLLEREILADMQPTLMQEVLADEILIAIDKDVRWERVVGALEILEAVGYFQISFLFGRPSHVVPPLETDDFSQCPAVQEYLSGTPEIVHPIEVITQIISAIPDCDCSGLPAIRSALWRKFRTYPQWGVTVRLGEYPETRLEVSAAGQSMWGEVAKKLIAFDASHPYRVAFVSVPE